MVPGPSPFVVPLEVSLGPGRGPGPNYNIWDQHVRSSAGDGGRASNCVAVQAVVVLQLAPPRPSWKRDTPSHAEQLVAPTAAAKRPVAQLWHEVPSPAVLN